MQLYLLDSTFTKVAVVDVFESLIWTERYNEAGDVTLVVAATVANRLLFNENMWLQLDSSKELMLIESVSEDSGAITLVGTTMAGFLANRMFRDRWQTTKDSWNWSDQAGNMALTIVSAMCVSAYGFMGYNNQILPNNLGLNELISNLTTGTAPTDGPTINVAVPYGTTYDAVKMVCDLDNLGFAIYQTTDGVAAFVFNVYRGKDRTSAQSANAQVIFGTAVDTLTNLSRVRSIQGYKTHAYAWANGMTAETSMGIAVASGASNLTNWQRRTLMVDASDVNAADYTAAVLKQILDQKAKDALANNNYVRMTDGQLVPQTTYVYGTDYFLGDIIELRGDDGTGSYARITEYIRAQDSTGTHAYPTLSVIS